MNIRIYRTPISALLLAFVAAACSKPEEQRTPPVPVQVAPVTRIAAPLTITANGVVEPLQTVAIEAQVGGALDTVIDGSTGILFDAQSVDGLCDAILRFEAASHRFAPQDIRAHACAFSRARFEADFKAFVDQQL